MLVCLTEMLCSVFGWFAEGSLIHATDKHICPIDKLEVSWYGKGTAARTKTIYVFEGTWNLERSVEKTKISVHSSSHEMSRRDALLRKLLRPVI